MSIESPKNLYFFFHFSAKICTFKWYSRWSYSYNFFNLERLLRYQYTLHNYHWCNFQILQWKFWMKRLFYQLPNILISFNLFLKTATGYSKFQKITVIFSISWLLCSWYIYRILYKMIKMDIEKFFSWKLVL